MHKQFYEGVRTKDIIDALKPKMILEAGFGAGTDLMMLLCYTKKPGLDYKIISLSDTPQFKNMTLPNDFIPKFIYIQGISYRLIPRWWEMDIPESFRKPIDFCIIDTDHNYYTLQKELEYIDAIMSPRCAIAMHDTASKPCEHHLYYSNALNRESNSMIQNTGYLNESPYPLEAVTATMDRPMMDAIDEFLVAHPDYKKIRHLDECCGCTILGRDFTYEQDTYR